MSKFRQRGSLSENEVIESPSRIDQLITRSQIPKWGYRFNALTWNEIEDWQRHNHFILRGYRASTNSYSQSFGSIWHVHNQTVNIWSHILGLFMFLVVAVYQIQALRNSRGTSFDLLLFGQFYLGVAFCLTFSSAFHIFIDHSEEIAHSFLLCDLAGIIILTVASFYPGVYYGFYCELQTARITVFAVGALIACLSPKFRGEPWQRARTIMLILVGLSGVFPMTHAALQFGISQARRQMGWDWYVWEAICYLSGALIYSVKIPERWTPGRFDIWGSSHQVFHICVLLGAFCHLTGAVKAVAYNNSPATKRC